MLDHGQELKLEEKYQGVLHYVDAKQFLAETPYTSHKINGAIKRFCHSTGAEKPRNFTEMEVFVADLFDFWVDSNPDVHIQGETVLHSALSNYIAFSIVWKAKSKSSSILNHALTGKVGTMIQFKNSLGQAVKMINSCAKRNSDINRKEIAAGLVMGYSKIMAISQGKEPVPEIPVDITRLIGAYLAGDKIVLDAAEKIKQLEYKPKAA